MECIICNKAFESKRKDAKYCSPKCRVKAARNPEKIFDDLTNLAKSTPEGKKAMDEIKNTPSSFKVRDILPNGEVQGVYEMEKPKKHKLWKEGDPHEYSSMFYLQYGAFTYDEIKK